MHPCGCIVHASARILLGTPGRGGFVTKRRPRNTFCKLHFTLGMMREQVVSFFYPFCLPKGNNNIITWSYHIIDTDSSIYAEALLHMPSNRYVQRAVQQSGAGSTFEFMSPFLSSLAKQALPSPCENGAATPFIEPLRTAQCCMVIPYQGRTLFLHLWAT